LFAVLTEKRGGEMHDIIIIGSGPAGLTAAIYASRAGLDTFVVGGMTWGGQLMLTGLVENFPGFPDGILGPELMTKMRQQAERMGVRMLFQDVTSVDFSRRPFQVKIAEQSFEAKAVVVASGASAKSLGLSSEMKLVGKGVSYCATCDAPFFRDRKVIVVGGGDTALDEALALVTYAREVTIVHRRDQLRACNMLQERVFANKKISFVWNSTVEEILGEAKVEGVKLKNIQTGEITTLPTDAVFVAIGYKPNTDFIKRQIQLDDYGYIVVHDETKTSVEGVFAAGDNQDFRYKQAITSAGSGAKAALDAVKYLQEHSL
jgi:thioredoxin reductase (NADPH)